jgi:hypothetical protein
MAHDIPVVPAAGLSTLEPQKKLLMGFRHVHGARGTASDRRWPVQRRSDAIGSAAVAEAQPRNTLGP